MGLSDLWWIAFLFIGLQPVIRQKVLEASRLRVLKRLEQARRSRVIALVHRQETMSLLGFPLMRYIDVNDSEEVLRAGPHALLGHAFSLPRPVPSSSSRRA